MQLPDVTQPVGGELDYVLDHKSYSLSFVPWEAIQKCFESSKAVPDVI